MTEDKISDIMLGYHAGLKGDDPRTCPYDKMTDEWKRWHFGQCIGVDVAYAYMSLEQRDSNE